MNTRMIAVLSVAAVTAVAAVAPACSSHPKKASPGSTTSSGASPTSTTAGAATPPRTSGQTAPTDYTTLLIQGSEISGTPPNVYTDEEPPTTNPKGTPGAEVLFRNRDGSERIDDTVLILPDAAGATTAMNKSIASLGGAVTGGNPQPVSLGNGGTMVSGASRDKSKSVTVLLFTEGKAFVTLEFDGPPDEAVPPDYAVGVADEQDAAIKKNLHS